MQVFSVAQFLAYVNDTFKAIWDPTAVCVEGEVSGFRVSQGQWVNFDLKDEEALVSAFMVLRNLTVPLQDGMRVRLSGYPRVYPKYGKFSFNAERVELVGEGTLRKALAALREKLAAEGLFDPERKRVLPRFPKRIALIASRDSAAYGDFVRILKERWSGLEIDLYHVLVQGGDAPSSIIKAIEMVNGSPPYEGGVRGGLMETSPHPSFARRGSVPYDALVLTRGGGSFEELMAFNDERLVRALYASKIPTLVGIGHERDLTLAEEVADVRGSTPTDCARRLVPDRQELLYTIATLQGRIAEAVDELIIERERVIDERLSSADRWLQGVRQKYEVIAPRVSEMQERWQTSLNERIESYLRLLASFDPTAVVRRGFAIVRDTSGAVLTSAKGVKGGERLTVGLRDGDVGTVVESISSRLL